MLFALFLWFAANPEATLSLDRTDGVELETNFANLNDHWLADTLVFRFNLKAMAVVRLQGEARYRFSNYKLFQTESKLVPE